MTTIIKPLVPTECKKNLFSSSATMASQGLYWLKTIEQIHLYHKVLSLYLEGGVKTTLEELHTGVTKHSVEGVR
jgi:hypothetical protein